MGRLLKIAILTTDNREPYREYHKADPWFGTAPEALLQGFAQLPAAEVHVISCTQRPMVSSPAKLADNIWFHSLHVPKLGWMRTLYQGCVRATRKKLREIQPDLVHGQGTERECALGAVFSGFPNVLTIHGNMQAMAELYRVRFGSFFWLAARLETATLKRTFGVFCNSAYTEGLVSPRASRTWRVPNPVRSAFFTPMPGKKPARVPAILNIGYLDTRKRQVELLETARSLHRRGLKFQLQFVGQGTARTAYGEKFRQELAGAEKAGYARSLGYLNTPQLIAAMDAADALVHFPAEEAFGLVVVEALARNLKIFGAATGGIVDIATGVEGAALFPPNDFTGLEAAIAFWIQTGGPHPVSAAAAMRERYHPLVIAKRHLEVYCEVLGKTKREP